MNPQYQNIVPPPPTAHRRSGLTPKLLIAGGGVLLLLVAVFIIMTLMNNNGPTAQMQRLSARFETLRVILDQGTKNIKGQDLKKIHSDASILVSGHSVTVQDAMERAGLSKIPKEITALEKDEATLETLASAQFNGRFDDAYKKALAQKLESTMALMREVHDKSSNKALKDSLSTAYEHFNGILNQLSKL